jgi:tetratricopeptide (TPR) repeat protein
MSVPLNNGTHNSVRNQADRLSQQGIALEQEGRTEDAIRVWQQALQYYQLIGDREAESQTYSFLSLAYTEVGDCAAADNSLRRWLALSRDRQDFENQIYALNSLGRSLASRGGNAAANSLFQEAMRISESIGNSSGQTLSYDSLQLLARGQVNPTRSAQYYAQTDLSGSCGFLYYQFPGIDRRFANGNSPPPRPLATAKRPTCTAVILPQEAPVQQLRFLTALAQIQQQSGNLDQARQTYRRAIAIAHRLQDSQQESLLLERLQRLTQNGNPN